MVDLFLRFINDCNSFIVMAIRFDYEIKDNQSFCHKTDRTGDILIIEAPMWDVILPPLGVSYISSFLEAHGHKNDILDLNIELYSLVPEDKKKFWDMTYYNHWAWETDFKELRESIQEYIDFYIQKILILDYKIICFSLSGANDLFSAYLANELKRINPNLFIVFGGSSCLSIHNNIDMPIINCNRPKLISKLI